MAKKNRSPEELMLDSIGEAFDVFCKRTGLRVMTRGADKHGSLVWEAGASDELNRYLTLALTEHGRRDRPFYQAELWIGADNNIRYARSLNKSWRLLPPAYHSWPDGQALVSDLCSAWDTAQAIREDELREAYVTPRLSPRQFLNNA